MEKEIYITPLSGRYASPEMNKIWSSDTNIVLGENYGLHLLKLKKN